MSFFLTHNFFSRLMTRLVLVSFAGLSFSPSAIGQSFPVSSSKFLPVPSEQVAMLKGFRIYPDQPFVFDFLVEPPAQDSLSADLQAEAQKLIRYFLAALTIPEKDLWVNLSPFEKDRIIPEYLGRTELGQVMLQQDYELKKLTAAYLSPENEIGKAFWDEVYGQVYQKYEMTEIPLDSFNKIWITPERIDFHQAQNTIIIVKSRLKLLLQEDYLALKRQTKSSEEISHQTQEINALVSQAVKEKVLPFLEEEINSGPTFAPLRQVFHSLALAVWLKNQIKTAPIAQSYFDQNKIEGIDYFSGKDVSDLYARYVNVFNMGGNEHVIENYDAQTQQIVVKRYTSGGVDNTRVLDHAEMVRDFTNVPIVSFKMSFDPQLKNDFAMMAGGASDFVPPGVDADIHKGKTVLVTGGDGYIGMAVIKNLIEQGSRVIILSRKTDHELKKFLESQGVEVYEVDLSDKNLLLERVQEIQKRGKIDAVVHLAGSVRPPESVQDPAKYYLNNDISTINLLEVMEKFSISNIVAASSVAVYNGSGGADEMINESSSINIRNPYTATKRFMERILEERAKNGGGGSILLRISNVGGAGKWGNHWYGPSKFLQTNTKGQKVPLIVISSIIQIILWKMEKKKVDVFQIQGNAIRVFVHVDDVAKGFLKSLAFMYHDPGRIQNQSLIFNMGSEGGIGIADLFKRVVKIIGISIRSKNQKGGSSEAQALVIDSSLAKEVLGWRAERDIEEIIKSTFEYHKAVNFEDLVVKLNRDEEEVVVRKIYNAIDDNKMISNELKFDILFRLFAALMNPGRQRWNNAKIDKTILTKFHDKVMLTLPMLRDNLSIIIKEDKDWEGIGFHFLRIGGYLQNRPDLSYLKVLHKKTHDFYQKAIHDHAELSTVSPANGGIDFQSVQAVGQTDADFAFAEISHWDFSQYTVGLVPRVLNIGHPQSLQAYLQNLP